MTRPRFLFSGLVATLLAAGPAVLAAPGAAPPDSPDVLLLTVDTLRPDALGWIGDHDRTPRIDSLARSGVRFPSAVAPAPVTQPSHASLFTGLFTHRHGLRDNGHRFPAEPDTLTARLRGAGWSTSAFVSGHPLTAEFGFDRDFDHFDDRFGDERVERDARQTTDAALAWRETIPGPAFVWVHYFDPHDPYQPPPSIGVDGYAGEVAFVDREIGRLLGGWPSDSPPLVVFAADHGESLGEHGERTHGFFVYESTIRVPLVLSWSGRLPSKESTAPVRLIDVAPTVLGLLGLDPLSSVDGIDLQPWWSDAPPEAPPPAFVESWRPWASYGWAPLRAVRQGRWKLVVAPRPELYDLVADPGETTNRVESNPGEARRLKAVFDRFEETPAADAPAADPEARRRLEALGYVGGGAATLRPSEGLLRLPDPKDRLGLWNALSAAVADLENGRPREALARFDAVVAEEPANPFAWLRGGLAAARIGDPEGAVRRLEKGLELRPDDAEAWLLLGRLRLAAGTLAAAESAFARACELRPAEPSAWEGLAIAAGRAGREEAAREALAEAARLEPTGPRLLQLALLELARGAEAEARRTLLAAVEIDPGLRLRVEADPRLAPLLPSPD